MTRDFDRVRAVFATSLIGRGIAACEHCVQAAWRNSSTGRAMQRLAACLRGEQAATGIRTIAGAVAVAAIAQPLLMVMMPRTVAPAMPWPVFVLVSMFAAVVAVQARSLLRAWPSSYLARWWQR